MPAHQKPLLFTRHAAGKTALGDLNAELSMPPVNPRRERMDDPEFDTGDARVQEPLKVQASAQWDQILQRFPEGMQEEIKSERPDGGDLPSIQELSTWWPRSPRPVEKSMQFLLSKKRNLQLLARASDEAIAAINQRWGLAIKPAHKRFDANPQRHMDYSRMPAATAKPSVLVNGEILWGCGRFIAALVRGDKSLWVWDIENSKRAALFTHKADVKMHTTPPVGAPRIEQRTHLDEDLKDELNPTTDDPDLIRHTTGVTSGQTLGRLFP